MSEQIQELPSVQAHIFNTEDLFSEVGLILEGKEELTAGKVPFEEFFRMLMPMFGHLQGETFIIVENDEAGDESPTDALAQVVNRYYEDSAVGYLYLNTAHHVVQGAIMVADEDFEGAGISFPEEDD